MDALDMLDIPRGEANGMPEVGDGRARFGGVDLGGAAHVVGGRPACPVMVGRVMSAAANSWTGPTGLLEWIEAWATAAVVDGRCRSIAVEGAEVAVAPGMRRDALSRIDAAVQAVDAVAAPGGGAIDVAITVLIDDEAAAVRVVVTGGRLDRDPVIRTIRLDTSIRPEPSICPGPSMRLAPMSRKAIPDEGCHDPAGFARSVRKGRPTFAKVGRP